MRSGGFQIVGATVCAAALCLAGCRGGGSSRLAATRPTTVPGLAPLTADAELNARVVPPADWDPDPLKASTGHRHRVWLSPSGRTAYGVIKFNLPLPVGHEATLWGFMNEMRRSEGQATLIGKQWDPALDGLRFVAEGGLYLVRTNLFVRGFDGWAIYAGTLRTEPIEDEELKLAETAREHTRLRAEPDDDE